MADAAIPATRQTRSSVSALAAFHETMPSRATLSDEMMYPIVFNVARDGNKTVDGSRLSFTKLNRRTGAKGSGRGRFAAKPGSTEMSVRRLRMAGPKPIWLRVTNGGRR